MNVRKLVAAVGIAAALLSAVPAWATQIDCSYAFGFNKGSPADQKLEALRLAYHIGTYNDPADPPVPPDDNDYQTFISPKPANVPATLPSYDPKNDIKLNQIDVAANEFSVNVTGWDYLMVKWANTSYYYYVGDLSGSQLVVNDVVTNKKDKEQDGSHYVLFKFTGVTVPDGGFTALLLGLSLSGLAISRRLIRH